MNTVDAWMSSFLAVINSHFRKELLDLRPMPEFCGVRHARNVVGSSKRERGQGEQKTSRFQSTKLIHRGCNLTAKPRIIYNGIIEMAARLGRNGFPAITEGWPGGSSSRLW